MPAVVILNYQTRVASRREHRIRDALQAIGAERAGLRLGRVLARPERYRGFVFVEASMTDALRIVEQVPDAIGFVGPPGKPEALPASEVQRLLGELEEDSS